MLNSPSPSLHPLLLLLLAVLPALHQRAGGVTVHRLPHLAGPECTAGVPDTPRAPERNVLSADQADQWPDAAQLLPDTGRPSGWIQPIWDFGHLDIFFFLPAC